MVKNLFSVPIFFIVFRETIEAAIIVSTLLGLAQQIAYDTQSPTDNTTSTSNDINKERDGASTIPPAEETVTVRQLARKLKIQIFAGAAVGIVIALAIGAAFIAVWFTKANDLYSKAEVLWEATFELIASIMIFVMGLSMLKLDRAKTKWRVKLQRAFEGKNVDSSTRAGKWVLFTLPLITVLREGLEAVVFVGGVSLGQQATSIPIAAITGLIAGLLVGFIVYQFASRSTLTIFMVVMTNLLFLIGAGLFNRAVWSFEWQKWITLLGIHGDDTLGDDPGTYPVQGTVWHLNCCNPNNNSDNQGWSIFNAILGWTNTATYGSVLSYVFYWLAVIAALVYMKFKEGRTTLFGKESEAGARRRLRKERADASADLAEGEQEKELPESEILPQK
ncbi:hypothetical protein AX14_002825 [Amanita brunnescens Koide BX004]|nr:hypothetical protein AX14_002825 [Amanita brunnescens Koide BX004]